MMGSITSRMKSLWKAMRSSDRLEREMDAEMRHHMELHAERLMRERGLDEESAKRVAKLEFGSVDNYKEAGRDARGLNRLSGFSMDLKLGARMLWKYPGLTIIGTLTIAGAVALAVSWFAFMGDLASPNIPLPEGNRLVELKKIDVSAGDEINPSLTDFLKWRDELTTVSDLTAIAENKFSVTTADKRSVTMVGARMTGAGFPLTRVPALLGRTITDVDEAESAPLVVVLAYREWQRLFDGDRAAIGKVIRVDGAPATVIGVMPETYGFPISEGLWLPLKTAALTTSNETLRGRRISISGRLARGATLKQAQAELKVIGERATAATTSEAKHYRPTIDRFMNGGPMAIRLRLANFIFILFLLVVCANVGTLVYARTATRESEIAVRSVMGAGRTRIVMQLFCESLVLTAGGAALGLAIAAFARPRIMALFWEVEESAPPFWFTNKISVSTIVYTFFLAVIAALAIGAVPALKATGKQLRDRIAQPGSGGSGLRFGKMSTAIVVFQVALCVACLPLAYESAMSSMTEAGTDQLGFPAEKYLTATIRKARPEGASQNGADLTPDLYARVRNRLTAEPGVLGVAFADQLPGLNHGRENFTIEGDTTVRDGVRISRVDENFFKVMHARIVAGRDFTSSDRGADAHVAIVDTAWVTAHLAGRNPIGVRINQRRGSPSRDDWYRIVGVVAGVEPAIGPGAQVLLYEPLATLAENSYAQVYARVTGDPEKMVPALRDIMTSVDPALVTEGATSLKNSWRPFYRSDAYFVLAISAVAAIILVFALIGIYALMSFTVSQRSREIGIRCALGAEPWRIIVSIFSRAMMQVGLGIVVGAAPMTITMLTEPGKTRLVGGIATLLIGFALIGCVIPALRALRIQPIDALRAE